MTVRTRQVGTQTRPFLVREDLYFCLELPALYVLSWLVPERLWPRACHRLERIKAKLGFFSPEPVATVALRVLGERTEDPHTFALTHAARRSEHHLQVLRAGRPGGWTAPLLLEGEEHLQRALGAERGAVLWVAHFCFNALAAKKALFEAGYKVWHLSRPEHGFSKSRFGVRFLNPIRVRAELPFLAGRVIIHRGQPGQARKEAARLLAGNGVVSITAGAWEGRKVAAARMLGGSIELATGAPALAVDSGAALLPVFTVRDDATGLIRVVIGERLTADSGMDRDDQLMALTQAFADRLTPHVLARPDQWRDWKSLKLD